MNNVTAIRDEAPHVQAADGTPASGHAGTPASDTEAPPAKKAKPRLTDEQRLQKMVDDKQKLIARLEQERSDALAKADELDKQLAVECPKLAGLQRALGELAPAPSCEGCAL